MTSVSVPWSGRRSRRAIAFALAVILPLFCSAITSKHAFLHPVPMALQFLCISLVATLGGLAPALIAVLLAILSRIFVLLAGPHPMGFTSIDLMRGGLLLLAAITICLICDRRVISEQKLEAALADLQERTDALADSLRSSKCACWTIDLQSSGMLRWYGGSYPVFGRPFSELEHSPSLLALLPPEDRSSALPVMERMKNSWEPVVFEHRVLWPDGEVHWLEMRAIRVPGQSCLWRGVTVDVTERKLAEDALLRAEKLAAMGRLASTVAHEINNPLEAVTNLLFLARGDRFLSEETRLYLATADQELARLGNITRLTLSFVRSTAIVDSVEVATIVDEVLAIFRHHFETRSIRVERHYEPGICIAIAPPELRQIVTNLIANAADAVPLSGARIVIRIAREDDSAVVLVEDNGDGVPPANLPRLFDPFFSTKQEVGTGIGLWVSKELVEKSRGHISVQSDDDLPAGISTRFRVDFPLAAAVQPALQAAAATTSSS